MRLNGSKFEWANSIGAPSKKLKASIVNSQTLQQVLSSQIRTVRWSNFDPRDPKMGVFLQSTEATPCGHLLKKKLTPENPHADTMFMAAMAMVLS
jgi:hypothetical protein